MHDTNLGARFQERRLGKLTACPRLPELAFSNAIIPMKKERPMKTPMMRQLALLFVVLVLSAAKLSAATVTVSPAKLSFGNVRIGVVSAPRTVTLTNLQKVTLNITNIGISGDFAWVTNACGATLAAGTSCKVTVSFTPTTLGPRSGLLTFADDASTGSQTVTLTGSGILRASAALKVVFGNQLITTAS